MRTRIAAQGPSMQLPCRRLRRPRRVLRHRPAASCSAPMASRLRWSTRNAGDASPAAAIVSIASTASASIKDAETSRRARRVPRRSREAAALPRWDAECRPAAHPDPPPPPWSTSGMAHPCPMPVHLPGELRNALASRKRHPDVGIPQWMPRPTQDFRLPSGLPVCRSRLRPRRARAASKSPQNTSGTKAAPAPRV